MEREEALCSVYPSLFNLSLHKEAMVANMWDRGRGEGCWSLTFLRSLNDANRCFLCEEDEDTIDHLLIHCKRTKTPWNLFLSVVGISWVFLRLVLHTLLACQGAAMGKKPKKKKDDSTFVFVLDSMARKK